MKDVLDVTWNIVQAVDIPVMADADTGGGNALNAAWVTERLIAMGAAGMNIEDQVLPKRCGHMAGKEVISAEEMVGKVRACADVRERLDPGFVINARTDAFLTGDFDLADVTRPTRVRSTTELEAVRRNPHHADSLIVLLAEEAHRPTIPSLFERRDVGLDGDIREHFVIRQRLDLLKLLLGERLPMIEVESQKSRSDDRTSLRGLRTENGTQRPVEEAENGLLDVAHILALVGARLEDRDSEYGLLFRALLELCQADISVDEFLKQASKEERDDSLEALDKIWEEEAVTFGLDDAAAECPSARPAGTINESQHTTPVHFVDSAPSAATHQ